jgi:hypothetical protein
MLLLSSSRLFRRAFGGTVAGNVAILATVVTSLVAGRLGALGRNVSDLAAVEATAVMRTGLVDGVALVAFQARVGAITGNVTRLATVVAGLVTGGTAAASAASTTTSSSAATAAASTTAFATASSDCRRRGCSRSFSTFLSLRHRWRLSCYTSCPSFVRKSKGQYNLRLGK